MSLSLSQLASLGEFIGGIAVVLTLIYLAFQLKQNTRTVRAATLANNTDIWASMLVSIASDEKLEAYLAGSLGSEEISARQFLQFFLLSRAMFVSFENQFHQHKSGMLEDSVYRGYERSFQRQVLAFRGFRSYWEQCSVEFSPEFVRRVDELTEDFPEADAAHLMETWRSINSKKHSNLFHNLRE